MVYNEKLTNRVREALIGKAGVEEKRMFNGIAFMVNGKLCMSVGDDRMMLRIDPALHESVLQKKGCHPMVMKDREYKGYILVKEDVLRNKEELNYWVQLALDFNPFAKASKKRK